MFLPPLQVIQRRVDGSVDFYRDWADYSRGFGDPVANLWLGNERLHTLTSSSDYTLRIRLEDWDGLVGRATYRAFKVASGDQQYSISVGDFSGNAGTYLLTATSIGSNTQRPCKKLPYWSDNQTDGAH